MKKQYWFRQAGGALLAFSALTILTHRASAIPLTWVDGPQAGQAFAGGGIQIKAVNYDTGTLYNTQPNGTVLTGAALTAAINRPALGPVAFTNEDSWGIVRITNIQATASDGVLRDVYNSGLSNFELTAMFWGIQDFHLTQVSQGSGLPGGGQVIDGTGMRVDVYSDFSENFNQTAGPNGRTGVSTYGTVTDGTLELSLLSTPGFINAAGTFGGVATEFEANTAATGYAALNVLGGASAAQFNTNAIGFKGSSGAGFLPGVGGQASTDIWFSFTSTQGVNGWDITSNDPMLANISGVPDTGSSLLMLGMGLVGLGLGYRFRRKA